jgi:hypothetical protein
VLIANKADFEPKLDKSDKEVHFGIHIWVKETIYQEYITIVTI